MRKIFYFLSLIFLLNGCAESMALLGTSATNGKLAQSTFNTALSYGVKQKTGKTPLQHALNYTKEKKIIEMKAENEIQPCVEFLEPVSEDICAVIKKRILKLSKVQSLN
tara:strand:+ start:183 stop:509 length:327 start_codon:yes stop_codon:yes gene_type:complete